MSPGHLEAQRLFMEIGTESGYEVRLTYSAHLPTDGVWLLPDAIGVEALPFVAIEVVASESLKTWRGSIATLEEVSPALGILLIQDEEIRRRLIRQNKKGHHAEQVIDATRVRMEETVTRSRQRIRVMSMEQLRRAHQLSVAITI